MNCKFCMIDAETVEIYLPKKVFDGVKSVVLTKENSNISKCFPRDVFHGNCWINANDNDPNVDGMYLIYYHWLDKDTSRWYYLFGVGVFKNGSWKSNEERNIICWMPLPEPPKEV